MKTGKDLHNILKVCFSPNLNPKYFPQKLIILVRDKRQVQERVQKMRHETMMLLLTPVSYVHCPLHTAPLWTTFYYDASQGYESEKLNVLKIQMGFCLEVTLSLVNYSEIPRQDYLWEKCDKIRMQQNSGLIIVKSCKQRKRNSSVSLMWTREKC